MNREPQMNKREIVMSLVDRRLFERGHYDESRDRSA
jgi:hypothetical protein